MSRPSSVERAAAHLLQSRDRVEDRGLARAVRTDEPGDAAALDVEVDVGHRVVATEADREPAGFKQRHCSPPSVKPSSRSSARSSAAVTRTVQADQLGNERRRECDAARLARGRAATIDVARASRIALRTSLAMPSGLRAKRDADETGQQDHQVVERRVVGGDLRHRDEQQRADHRARHHGDPADDREQQHAATRRGFR